jgi:hypothetical protein
MEVTLAPTRDAAVKEMLSWVEYATMGVELLAVAIIVVAILSTTVSYSIADCVAASGPRNL